ncbi:hypothetical protein AB3F22_12360 [Actinomyces johnsonii]|uniref:hypothetical protein n=1 Tax=Actinomyces johnsonii TaxID=544581 RepID=UPI0004053E84|nr:hypothetical protein [Actinomyces johnsonii]
MRKVVSPILSAAILGGALLLCPLSSASAAEHNSAAASVSGFSDPAPFASSRCFTSANKGRWGIFC